MGRSVMKHSNSVLDVYIDYNAYSEPDPEYLAEMREDLEDPDWYPEPDWYDWELFKEALFWAIQGKFSSMEREEGEVEREVNLLCGNGHSIVTLSEYMGLVRVGIAPRENSEGDVPALSRVWTERHAILFEETLHKAFGSFALRRVGSFSNGESFYEQV